jgi:RHS repeat-associated protein
LAAAAVSGGSRFTYDSFNRLSTKSESGLTWEQENYDPFGNRWVPTSSSSSPPLTLETATAQSWYKAANNRVNTWSYDGAGNVTAVQGMLRTFIYDGENRQITATINSAPTTYTYDGEGRRVTKTVSAGATTTYVYDAMGHLAAEYNGAVAASGTTYLSTDHLGSTRLITGSTGAILNCYDYLPFGGDIPAGTNGRPATSSPNSCYPAAPDPADGETLKFTSKERDSETGLDYFGARYFSSAQGRFTSPDPKIDPYDIADPQTWNKYTYARNNPLRYVDADGNDFRDYLKGIANAFTTDFANSGGRSKTGNDDFKLGQVVGDVAATVVGAVGTVIGSGGEVLGVGLDLTGGGAVVGVPINVAAGALAIGGAKGAATGVANLGDAFFSSALGPKEGVSGGPGAGKDFGVKTKGQAVEENKAANNGQAKCVFCGEDVGSGTDNKINIDHAKAKANGGANGLNNANVTCAYCNQSKGTSDAPKNPKPCASGQSCSN